MTADSIRNVLATKRALVVGVGGLGCPAALGLLRGGVGTLVLVDDDLVELSNLHRQILYGDDDVDGDKLEAAAHRLTPELFAGQRLELVRSRFLPENALSLAGDADIVVEGADNFATKFLAADACFLRRRPVVHGAAIRWRGTAWAIAPEGKPCYRCLFEDLPDESAQPNCAEAGVMGPVVGVLGARMADLALCVLSGDTSVYSGLWTYDGKADRLRTVPMTARPSCRLCGHRQIFDIEESRYTNPSCVA